MKKGKTYHKLIIVITFLIITILSCSTEKNAWINRSYHNTTAHYNGYFNAGEIIKETMLEFELNRKEDYSKVIPVFIYPNNEESKALYSPMDTAASKCETVIARNSMPKQKVGQFKNEEWCKWIDDNWFVVGKSQFLKRDYLDSGALEKFTFIEKQYKGESISHVAKLWRAKTLIELKSFDEAKEVLDELNEVEELLELQEEESEKEKQEAKEKAKKIAKRSSSKKRKSKKGKNKEDKDKIAPLPKKFDRDLMPVYADLFLRQKMYKEAEEYLNLAIDLTKKRKFKTRLMFILAQVLQESGGNGASDLYVKVVKRNPVYDMAFQAKINRALAYSGGDSKSIKSQLLKMLKDEKNEDYLDQIYYALGDIELREGHRPLGITYLEKSVVVSKANKVQKSKSFLRLGKLYYTEKNYAKAQQYYDSTMSVLPKDHFEYESIEEKNVSLSALVKNLNIIKEGDSISQLCNLSESELLAKIDDIIEQKILANEAAEEQKRLKEANQIASKTSGKPTLGVFWAYEENLRASGFSEFKELWGDRKFEDNWRRSDKSSIDFEDEEELESKEVDKELTADYYLKDLPCNNDEEMAKILDDVMNAMYDAGDIYKSKLENESEAKASFVLLTNRFLPKEKAVAGLYQLYLMSSGEDLKTYKNKILNDYPNSEYAKIIKDPNYKQKEELAKSRASEDYKIAYNAYTNNNFEEAISLCTNVIEKDKNNALICKYYYLKAVSLGQKYAGTDSLSYLDNALTEVVKHCKGDEVYAPSKALLDKLRNVQSVSDAQSGKSTYVYSSDSKHFFVLVFPNDKGSINKAKAKVADFNTASFSTKNLNVKSSFVDQTTQVIVTKSFKNKEEAMDYYIAFKVNKKQVKNFTKGYDFFVITDKNFASLYVDKDVQKYVKFFDKNYVD